MATKKQRSIIQAAISDEGQRRALYEAAAEKAGLTYSQWIIRQCDRGLTKDQRQGLLVVVGRGERGGKPPKDERSE